MRVQFALCKLCTCKTLTESDIVWIGWPLLHIAAMPTLYCSCMQITGAFWPTFLWVRVVVTVTHAGPSVCPNGLLIRFQALKSKHQPPSVAGDQTVHVTCVCMCWPLGPPFEIATSPCTCTHACTPWVRLQTKHCLYLPGYTDWLTVLTACSSCDLLVGANQIRMAKVITIKEKLIIRP